MDLDNYPSFFSWLFDRKCFQRIHKARIKRMFPRMSTKQLIDRGLEADRLFDGMAEEMLKELCKRLKEEGYGFR